MNPDLTPSLQEYWSTIAATVPVVALALVVEARTIMRGWGGLDTPPWLRRLQALVWGGLLLGLTYSMSASLAALAGNAPVPEWSPIVATNSVVFSMTSLVLVPTIDLLVRGYVEWIARFRAWHPILRWTVYYSETRSLFQLERFTKQSRSAIDQSKRDRKKAASTYEWMKQTVEIAEQALENGKFPSQGRETVEKARAHLDTLEGLLPRTEEAVEKAERMLNKERALIRRTLKRRRERRERWSEMSAQERANIIERTLREGREVATIKPEVANKSVP